MESGSGGTVYTVKKTQDNKTYVLKAFSLKEMYLYHREI